MFKALFGGKKKAPPPKPPSAIDAITNLARTEAQLDKRSAHLEKRTEALLQKARTLNRKGDKRGARNALKQKQLLMKQMARIDAQKFNIAATKGGLESAQSGQHYINAIAQSNQAMKALASESVMERADNVMEDAADNLADVEELGDTMSRDITGGLDLMDDDDLDDELARLEAEDIDGMLMQAGTVPAGTNTIAAPGIQDATPAVIQDAPAAPAPVVNREQQELNELNALMGMT